MLGTAASVGPGITISALSSAIAFFMAGITEFAGVAELGLIAGGGIVLCFERPHSAVLPALIRLVDANRLDRQLPLPLDFHLWLRPLVSRPRLMLTAAVSLTVVLGMGVTRLTYDYNLMHLEPANLESVELEQKLVTETKDSAYFALSMARTSEEVAARKARFLQLPTVERVDEIATRFLRYRGKTAHHRADPAASGGPARQAADYSRGLAGKAGANALRHRAADGRQPANGQLPEPTPGSPQPAGSVAPGGILCPLVRIPAACGGRPAGTPATVAFGRQSGTAVAGRLARRVGEAFCRSAAACTYCGST